MGATSSTTVRGLGFWHPSAAVYVCDVIARISGFGKEVGLEWYLLVRALAASEVGCDLSEGGVRGACFLLRSVFGVVV